MTNDEIKKHLLLPDKEFAVVAEDYTLTDWVLFDAIIEECRFEINQERMENGLPPLEGWEEWGKHQRPVSKERAKEIDKALGIERCQCGYPMPCNKKVPIGLCKSGKE